MSAFCAYYSNGTRRRLPLKHSVPICSASKQTDMHKAPMSASKSIDHNFAQWASSNGIDMSKISLAQFKQTPELKSAGSRGMIAQVAIKKGQPLITVTKGTTLQVTSLDRKKSPIPGKISQDTWSKLPWYARLGLLVHDAKMDATNPLYTWAHKLPTTFNTPFHWDDKELLELQNPIIEEQVRHQRKQYKKWFNEINKNSDNSLARGMSFNTFVTAVECVRSRAFSGPLETAPFKERLRVMLFILANVLLWPTLRVLPLENALNGGLTALLALGLYDIFLPRVLRVVQGVQLKRYAMAPGIDFINHSSAVTGYAEVSYQYFTEGFVVQSGENYESGDQVFISYGAQGNDPFLQYYGFVEKDNPAETYTFGSEVSKLLGVVDGKLVAKRSGFLPSVVNAVAKRLGGKKEAALEALRELCEAELNGMPTSIEEDKLLLEDTEIGSKPQLELAIRYRIEKKLLLRDLAKKGASSTA